MSWALQQFGEGEGIKTRLTTTGLDGISHSIYMQQLVFITLLQSIVLSSLPQAEPFGTFFIFFITAIIMGDFIL